MKILLVCMECALNSNKRFEHAFAELQDSGLYSMECRHGHKSIIAVQEQKFEMLFELGANAIVDGYYREAVTSFTSALERFYEFYIELICSMRGIESEAFNTAWKTVAKLSERQFGGYLFLYLYEAGKPPPLLPKAAIELRNSVVHNGKIPSREETLQFGQSILDVITPVLSELKRNHPNEVSAAIARHIRRIYPGMQNDIIRSTMTFVTTISAARHSDDIQPNLNDAILRIVQMRRAFAESAA